MDRAEIRHALQRGPAETLAEPLAKLLEGLGWTLQETHGDATDTWTKWFGREISEIRAPEKGTDAGNAPEHADPVRAIQRLALLENLSHEYLLEKLAREEAAEPARVILEDIRRSGVRHALAERTSRDLLDVMGRSSPGDPPEVDQLLWTAHTALCNARGMSHEGPREPAGRTREGPGMKPEERAGDVAGNPPGSRSSASWTR